MTDTLNEMETALTDLLQSGLATWGDTARFEKMAETCEIHGLHTGASLMRQIRQQLDNRAHALEKNDLHLAETICRMVRYITLCREKSQEDSILARWQHEGGTP